jgi:DNA-binding NtrC family response regulator
MSSLRILVVDRDGGLADALGRSLSPGQTMIVTANKPDTLARLAEQTFDLLLADDDLCQRLDLDLLAAVRRHNTDMAVVFVSGNGTIEAAVRAMRHGAFDYLSKPLVDEQLRLSVERAVSQQSLMRQNRQLIAQLDRHRQLEGVIGTSERMNRIFETVEAVAATRATVLITGESGTGKTMLARAIHNLSPRAGRPFIDVNCGALPDTLLESELFGHARGSFTGAVKDKAGKFEEAHSGTIFLDEIANASPALQVKLLRVIQSRLLERVGETETREVDVRIILATNSDLAQLVAAGRFREDLYYRINVVNVDVPPLRERPEDIPFLLDHFLGLFRDYHGKWVDGCTPEALDYLLGHSWPGNIRELENAVERAVVLARGNLVDVGDLPPTLTRRRPVVELHSEVLPLKKALEEPERLIIRRALEICRWNRQKTADMLEVNRTTLFHKMKKHGLLPGDARPAD